MKRKNGVGLQTLSVLIFLSFMFFLNLTAVNSEQTPQWLKRVEFSAEWESDKKPTVYFQTVQPLFQDDAKTGTFFIQPRISSRNQRTMYNLGFGYRRLLSDDLLLGVNLFGDYQEQSQHGRIGMGFEALGQVLEARTNLYLGGITPKRNIVETATGFTIERVADGIDYELGAPVPRIPWLKLYGSGFWYDFKEFSDKVGWKTRLEATINDYGRLEFFTWDDNKGDQEYGGRVRFTIAFDSWVDFIEAFKISGEAFPEKDLTQALLIPVERNHDIVVEKYIKTKTGLTVEAGRT